MESEGSTHGESEGAAGSDLPLGVAEDSEEFQYHSGAGDLDLAGESTDREWSIRCFDVVKRLTPDVELKANVQYERWLIPIYKTGRQTDTSTTFQLTWYPRIARRF